MTKTTMKYLANKYAPAKCVQESKALSFRERMAKRREIENREIDKQINRECGL